MLMTQQGNIAAVACSWSLLIKNDISNLISLLDNTAKMAFNMIFTLFNLLLQNLGYKIDIWTFYCIMAVHVISGINKVKLVVLIIYKY